jgi:hypothetical protein
LEHVVKFLEQSSILKPDDVRVAVSIGGSVADLKGGEKGVSMAKQGVAGGYANIISIAREPIKSNWRASKSR